MQYNNRVQPDYKAARNCYRINRRKRIFLVVATMLITLLFSGLLSGCETLDSLIMSQDQPLSERTIIAGLKEALERGATLAVEVVSREDGFFGNMEIRIHLPEELEDVDQTLRCIGLGSKMDEFEESMNRAAEQAAALAIDIFIDAIKQMTIGDAGAILQGADDAATRYLENNYRDRLYHSFYPVVEKAMQEVGLARIYKFILDKYNSIPLIEKKEYNLDEYITNRALDGLFLMVSREEKEIRTNPVARVTELLKKVFG
ncbi:MAG: DUF4197 family protein [Spirochaeta sp.]|nr:DUF4197 family protein [Spirochaeta sp.]